MRVLVSYDISNHKTRRKVVKIMEGAGYRVQYSVFECDLSPQQYKVLKNRLKRLIKPETTDSIRFYRLTGDCADNVEVLGNDMARTLGVVLVI